MPTAKKPTPKTLAKTPAAKSGVAKGSEEPVSSKAAPNPRKRADGNTAATRTPKKAAPKAESYPATGKDRSRGANDHTEATGRDHPSQQEMAKALLEKLHGTSDQRINGPGGSPGGPRGGFDPRSNARSAHTIKGNSMMRRTQGKGG